MHTPPAYYQMSCQFQTKRKDVTEPIPYFKTILTDRYLLPPLCRSSGFYISEIRFFAMNSSSWKNRDSVIGLFPGGSGVLQRLKSGKATNQNRINVWRRYGRGCGPAFCRRYSRISMILSSSTIRRWRASISSDMPINASREAGNSSSGTRYR